jgi:hypothetical protein
VEAPGIEPGAAPAEPDTRQSVTANAPEPLAQTLARETEIDPELARVNAAWPDLPEAIRRAVLALIDAARGANDIG